VSEAWTQCTVNPREKGYQFRSPHPSPAVPAPRPKAYANCIGVAAVSKGIPLNLTQRWLGHAQISTTAICADAVGEEEKSIAAKMW
jgi:hypothetical protein